MFDVGPMNKKSSSNMLILLLNRLVLPSVGGGNFA